MARPLKQGVDYFPLDVHLDTKFKFVEIKFGLEGFGAVVRLMQMIYQQGYWAKWGDDEALLFSSENRIEFETLDEIVKECLKREVFNKELYEEHQILTSRGIQKRYKEIVRRRKDVNVITDYLLIDDIIQVIDDINPTSKGVIDDIKTSSSKHDDDKSTQRKGKEIEKEKEKKQKEEKVKHLNHVLLSENEYKRLVNDFGQRFVDSKIEDLNNYIGSKGKRYRDHNLTLRAWIKKDAERNKGSKANEVPSFRPDSVDLGGMYG